MPFRSVPFIVSAFLILGWLGQEEALAQSSGRGQATQPATHPAPVTGEDVAHWSGLPVWGRKEARKYGFELPEPLGVSAGLYSEQQPFNMPKLKLGPHNGNLVDVGSLLRVTNIKTAQTARTARFDSWILPFLNLYAVVGTVEGHADITTRPAILARIGGPKLKLGLDYEGPTVGLGGTLAGGFKPFKTRPTILFGLTDLTFTQTYLDFKRLVSSLEPISVTVLSARFGVRDRILHVSPFGDLYGSVWAGAMYEGVEEVMNGDLGPLGMDFQGHVKSPSPVNTIVGGRLEIGKHFDVMIDAGLGCRKSLMLSATIRF